MSATPEAEAKLGEAFVAVAGAEERPTGRSRSPIGRFPTGGSTTASSGSTSKAICDGPRSQDDYIEIAHEFHTVLVSEVPAVRRRAR